MRPVLALVSVWVLGCGAAAEPVPTITPQQSLLTRAEKVAVPAAPVTATGHYSLATFYRGQLDMCGDGTATAERPKGAAPDWNPADEIIQGLREASTQITGDDPRRLAVLDASCAESFKGKIAVATCTSTIPLRNSLGVEVSVLDVAKYYNRATVDSTHAMQSCALSGGAWDDRP